MAVPAPHDRIWFRGDWGLSAEELAYKVDQAFAAAGIPYFPESFRRWQGLCLVVPRAASERVTHALQPLRPPPPEFRSFGHRFAVTPRGLSRRDADHPWIFEGYIERLEDGRTYHALYFRDLQHRRFGRMEWILASSESWTHRKTLERLAHRLVTEPLFRGSLLSDLPEVERFWK